MATRLVQARDRAIYSKALYCERDYRHQYAPNYNASVGHKLHVIHRLAEPVDISITLMKWGYRPDWAALQGYPVATCAHYADLAKKRYYNGLWANCRRAVVPLDGWYEWQTERGQAVPHFIYDKSKEILWAAALVDYDKGRGNFVLIVDDQAPSLVEFDSKVPLLLDRYAVSEWLSPVTTPTKAMEIATSRRAALKLTEYRVGFRVNNPEPNDRELLKPVKVPT